MSPLQMKSSTPGRQILFIECKQQKGQEREKGGDARRVKPSEILIKTADRYSGRAETSAPMNTVYDFALELSNVVHGKSMMA